MAIPKLIHQIYLSDQKLPDIFSKNIIFLKNNNPQYTHHLYGIEEVESIILKSYGKDMLKTYLSINPAYGAVRADLFRYLIIYKLGGVYLDIKSTALKPLNNVIYPDDQFVICQWYKKSGMKYADCGYHEELKDFFNGEFQQWNIISEPKSPFMEAVIHQMLINIKTYDVKVTGVGRKAALLLGSSIMYTKLLSELMKHHPHRLVGPDSKIGLCWTICPGHNKLMKTDYTKCIEKLII